MYIKFLDHGRGSGKGAADYLTQEKDHLGNVRAEVEVLRGDPDTFAMVTDSLTFEQKYTSGVIAWHKDDDPTPEEIQAVLDDFERTAFAGLEKDQYHFLAVMHVDDDGAKHVHVMTPRVDLHSGKSMNIAPPGHEKTFDALRDKWNNEQGWARPDDPTRAKLVQPQHNALIDAQRLKQGLEVEPNPKALITAYLTQRVESGHIQNRSDVVEALTEIGAVTRQGKDYISIKPDGHDKAIRLKGALYDEQFSPESLAAVARENSERQRQPDSTRELITADHQRRAAAAREQLERAIGKRTEYNQNRYPAQQRSEQSRHAGLSELEQQSAGQAQRGDAEGLRQPQERGTAQAEQRPMDRAMDDTDTVHDLADRLSSGAGGSVVRDTRRSAMDEQRDSYERSGAQMGVPDGQQLADVRVERSEGNTLQDDQVMRQKFDQIKKNLESADKHLAAIREIGRAHV